jgi:hypothetical protein
MKRIALARAGGILFSILMRELLRVCVVKARALRAWCGLDPNAATMLVSVGVAEVATVVAVAGLRSPELGLLFLAAGACSALQWLRSRRAVLDAQAFEQLRQARAQLEAKRYGDAYRSAEGAVHTACKSGTRNTALTLLAQAALHAGHPGKASAALRSITPRAAVDPGTLAAVENANGHPERAIATLDRVRSTGGLDRTGARLLIDLHVSAGDYERVTDVAIELSRVLGPDDVQVVAAALQVAQECELATRLVAATVATAAAARGEILGRGLHPLRDRKPRAPSSS